ncbi:MAG: DEAD/DEAH box helicase [Opitutales bacterium]
MMDENNSLTEGISVLHQKFGLGVVELDRGETVIVRFEEGLQQCLKSELATRMGLAEKIEARETDSAEKVINRMQAEAIVSINDAWGVFSPSRIALYPHQLWVCHKVGRAWPMRWLVADDVGLGKTVEAGLILWPLLARKQVQRVLILCPASLVRQWSSRLLEMFDIRTTNYHSDSDRRGDSYWQRHDRVVASLHTLRDDRKGRWDRLAEAEKWDLVIVDEAHHLNADEDSGRTKAYKLVEFLQKQDKVDSLLFFTGTPHRGKNYGFYSLLQLLRPEWFSPSKPSGEQVPRLREAVIRNNKEAVTDLKGKKLFSAPNNESIHYAYSDEEQLFYESLSNFIKEGKAYAKTLSFAQGSAVGLILSTMQKLAASSIAAVSSAMRLRHEKLRKEKSALEEFKKVQLEDSEALLEDGAEKEAEKIINNMMLVTRDEVEALEHLIGLASRVKEETKLRKIVDLIESSHAGDSVLLFTEYKATQSLLYEMLTPINGKSTVGFINGDDILILKDKEGNERKLWSKRKRVAANFNSGRLRFLISTEAAGEGIDLHGSCNTLIHVDLPWNPMRLHQRVGRINRIGQTRKVQVYNLMNPSTIEAKIWIRLNAKIENIMQSLGKAMDEPEDLRQIVLGAASPKLYEELFQGAGEHTGEKFADWFDQKTATLGGKRVLDTVSNLVGNASKFDYHDTSGRIPRVDLPNLESFVALALKINGRRVTRGNNGLSFKTPKNWLVGLTPKSFEDLNFKRKKVGDHSGGATLGVGNPMLNHVLAEARAYEDCIASCTSKHLVGTLLVYKVHDRITGSGDKVLSFICGLEMPSVEMPPKVLLGWELLLRLNKIAEDGIRTGSNGFPFEEMKEMASRADNWLTENQESLNTGFKVPVFECIGLLAPEGETT